LLCIEVQQTFSFPFSLLRQYHLPTGPTLPGAEPSARPRRGTPLTSGAIRSLWSINRAMTFLMKILAELLFGDDLCVGYMVKQQLFMGLGHNSGFSTFFHLSTPEL